MGSYSGDELFLVESINLTEGVVVVKELLSKEQKNLFFFAFVFHKPSFHETKQNPRSERCRTLY